MHFRRNAKAPTFMFSASYAVCHAQTTALGNAGSRGGGNMRHHISFGSVQQESSDVLDLKVVYIND